MIQSKKCLLFCVLIIFSRTSFSSVDCPLNGYTIGIQKIDYTPHYNYVGSGSESNDQTKTHVKTQTNHADFFSLFVDWLESKTSCQFTIVALPIKRLNITFENHGVDFVYPDNPNWHQHKPLNPLFVRQYSPALAIALGSTIVRRENKYITLDQFSELAIPRGFSPVAWYPLQAQYPITFREVSDAEAALRMVQANRVSGADIELNVAQYIINTKQLAPMSVAKNLPYTPTGFHLVTVRKTEMLKQISKLINENSDELAQMRKSVNLIEHIAD